MNNKLIFVSGAAYSGTVSYSKQLAKELGYKLIDVRDIIHELGYVKEVRSKKLTEMVIEVIVGLAFKAQNKLIVVNTKQVDILIGFSGDIESLPDFIWLNASQEDRFFKFVENETQDKMRENFDKFMSIDKADKEIGLNEVEMYCKEWGRTINN